MLGAAMFAPIALIGIFSFGTSEAQSWLKAERAEHQAQLATLKAGRWPDTPAGKRISGLADRLGPDTAERIRRYWQLTAFIVAEAEDTLIEEAEGDVAYDRQQILAAFAELDGLRKALGRSTLSALNALLPFSRNDQWEVRELRERLRRSR
jgi:hypothetical protein